ncbi:PLP-dependent aminotransferase family protein [Alcaligenaceae bacterium CGII-47]|nr:PLP-dependent aminotransferase family protein [Alcaligenaceae bacterium CGII-47]
MTLFEPIRDRKHAPSLVDQAADAIEQAIRGRVFRPGMALPSIRQFARDHGLSTFTVMAAYGRLVAQGLLQARPGADYRVTVRRRAEVPAVSTWVAPQVGPSWLLSDVFADHSISIKAGCGWLPPDWHNEAGLQQSLRQLARVPVGQMTSYGHPLGYHPLREHIVECLGEQGLEAQPDQVLLTHGATQALDVVVRTVLRPGDEVVVESPCYANLLQILHMNGVVVHSVPRTREGVCIDTLQRLARAHSIKAVFVTTVLHNPTGASFSMAGAFQLLQLAEQYDLLVIEDDVSREMLGSPAPLLAALGGTERVIYVSGFSKNVMPSMRVGYLLCSGDIFQACARTKMSLGLTSAQMMERAVYQVLRQGRHGAYMRRVRERLALAHDAVAARLHEHGFEIHTEPGAGLFLWARPARVTARQGALGLAARALRDGIWLAPGAYFDPQGEDTAWFRFNVAYSGHPRLWRFFREAQAMRR